MCFQIDATYGAKQKRNDQSTIVFSEKFQSDLPSVSLKISASAALNFEEYSSALSSARSKSASTTANFLLISSWLLSASSAICFAFFKSCSCEKLLKMNQWVLQVGWASK